METPEKQASTVETHRELTSEQVLRVAINKAFEANQFGNVIKGIEVLMKFEGKIGCNCKTENN